MATGRVRFIPPSNEMIREAANCWAAMTVAEEPTSVRAARPAVNAVVGVLQSRLKCNCTRCFNDPGADAHDRTDGVAGLDIRQVSERPQHAVDQECRSPARPLHAFAMIELQS